MTKKRIACIDGDSILYICLHNKIKYNSLNEPILDDFGNKIKEDKSFDDCKEQLDDFMHTLLEDTQSTHYSLALTVGKNFRYMVDPNYKANRLKLDKPKYFYELREYMVVKWKAFSFSELEADDICLISSNKLNNEIDTSFIASLDSDLLKLKGTHYDYKKRCFITTNQQEADEKFWSDMITGQSGDGIKGIPGKGEKFVKSLIDGIGYINMNIVFHEYVNILGEYNGIEEFYKNYKLLKIKDSHNGFVVPEPIKYEKVDNLDNNIIINF